MNGKIVEASKAKISPFDHGFLYGVGLFETFRTYQGHPFLLDDHFRRLHDSANELGIRIPPYDRQKTTDIIYELLEKNSLEDGYFRWNISAGEEQLGLTAETYNRPTTIVFVKQLPSSFLNEKKGKVLKTNRNSPETKERLKTHHFLNNIIGKREAGSDPSVEGLFLTEQGHLSEGVVSNLFWINGMTLYTPDLSCGGLNGVTRQFVMRLASKCGFKVREGKFHLSALYEAEEVFMTNSVQELVALNDIDGQSYPGKNGPLYKRLFGEYREYTPSLWSRNDMK